MEIIHNMTLVCQQQQRQHNLAMLNSVTGLFVLPIDVSKKLSITIGQQKTYEKIRRDPIGHSESMEGKKRKMDSSLVKDNLRFVGFMSNKTGMFPCFLNERLL